MFSPNSPKAPNLGRTTIISSWAFTAAALLTVILMLWSRRILRRHLRRHLELDVYMTLIAFIISVALVVHVTWAIFHEGLDKQVEEVPDKQRATTIRVKAFC